jgi:methyl-accepting chemotaxis protein
MTIASDPPNQPPGWNPIAALRSKIKGQPSPLQAPSIEMSIRQSIDDLAAEMNGIARGDLTIHAEVKDNITGPIACSINYMVHQLRQIIRVVQDATHQVSGSTLQMRETTEKLSRESETQAAQIVDTSSAIDEMVESVREVAENTSQSATVAEEARQVAIKGADVVSETIKGMDRIRSQVQSTSKRIKRLGESSQEIGEIVKLISDVADRTSILALNASIQAAMAGEAGQGFHDWSSPSNRRRRRSSPAWKRRPRRW